MIEALLPLALQAATLARTESKQGVLAEYGACIVKFAPDRARKLMSLAPDSKEADRLTSELVQAHRSCLGWRLVLSMTNYQIRGAIAEALLLGDARRMAALAATPARPAARAPQVEGPAFAIGYGQCLAQAEPAKAAALLRTAHGSPDERAAVLAFGPALNACMPEGIAYRMNIANTRIAMSEALYHSVPIKTSVGG